MDRSTIRNRFASAVLPEGRNYTLNIAVKIEKNLQNPWELLKQRLQAPVFIQNPGNWEPHELKPSDVERRF